MLKTCIGAAALAGRLAAASELSWTPPSLVPKAAGYEVASSSSGIAPCDALKEAGLGDRLLFATDADYEPQIQSWYAENARMRPDCLVLPHNTEEVATTLTALVKVNNGAGDWHIAVRSGGHSFPGSNNIANGVTIDLTMMNSSSYDPETKLAKIQPGGRWRNTYADLQKAGVVVAGGRDGDVGVGGFLLGGGNSFFSGRMGFGCDSVKNFEVVLANGTVVNANSTANSDLWRALKGGGSNYGIVTRFDMEALPTRDLYYDKRTLSFNYTESVIDAVVGYANQDQSLADNALITLWSHNASSTPETLVSTIYVNTQGKSNATSAFDKVRSLPALFESTNSGTTLTFRNDPQILRRCVELHEDSIKRLSKQVDPKKFTSMLILQPIPSYMATIAEEQGGNILGLESIGGNSILFNAGVAVTSDDKDFAIAKAELAVLTAQVKAFSKSVKGDLDFIYLNYAESNQDPLGSYGAKNIQHMQDVAAKYDPTEVFQKRIPGGFKISRCDNCKARKTKCDRRSPCASCVTLNVICRTTRRATEKRQRVLLSSKYDEAVQDVSRQLGDVKEMLQTLLLNRSPGPNSTATSSESTHHTPPPMIDEQVPTLSDVNEGYNGDPSFLSHAHLVENALGATFAASDFANEGALDTSSLLSPLLSPRRIAELLHDADTGKHVASDHTTPKSLPQPYDPPPGDIPLPPIDLVLKILRMSKASKQRFFVDVPTFEEDEFIDLCRGVYFATEPISIWKWICVNVGLYYIFLGAKEADCEHIGTTVEILRFHTKTMKTNAETAMQSLRLCSEPSMESCRALVLLVSHSAIAWRLISAAARACLDLGFHRLPGSPGNEEVLRQSTIFWHTYLWDKGLALTCGRTPVIHHYDVTNCYPVNSDYLRMMPGRIYAGLLDYSIVAGEIQRKLFSASALRAPQQNRVQYAREFASKLLEIQESVAAIPEDDPIWDKVFFAAAVLLDIKMYCLLTIVYRILPPSSVQSHPLQCSDECVEAARTALSKVVEAGEHMLRKDPFGWYMFLNVTLSLVPFVPFIVLAGNAISTSSSADLALLSSVLSVLEPPAANSPTARKVYNACERLNRIASALVSSSSEASLHLKEYQEQTPNAGLSFNGPTDESDIHSRTLPNNFDYAFPMAQHDWDSVMTGFESELRGYDSRALTNIMEPYIANTSW
ncbi:hypothetical protein F4814DRAFT_439883 [Daldinia grandis]|nr:hypothetical protein F4814DRAFT_439883 [Daldinia grandis]